MKHNPNEKNSNSKSASYSIRNKTDRRSSVNMIWGTFMIFLGIILFSNSVNSLPQAFWTSLISFWPVLLILIGFSILLGDSTVSKVIVFTLSFLLFAIVLVASSREAGLIWFENLPFELDYLFNERIFFR
jgi:hypothetical protein